MYEIKKQPTDELGKIEVTIENVKEMISAKESLDRLRKNRDFKKLFLTNYLETEPARLTAMLAHPACQKDEEQNDIMGQLKAISSFGQYMAMVNTVGTTAKESLEEHENTREEILREGLE